MDQLERLAGAYGIAVVFTDNRRVILSGGVADGQPVLRAGSCLRGCPSPVAEAVIGFYRDPRRRAQHKQVILDYLATVWRQSQAPLLRASARLTACLTRPEPVEDELPVARVEVLGESGPVRELAELQVSVGPQEELRLRITVAPGGDVL